MSTKLMSRADPSRRVLAALALAIGLVGAPGKARAEGDGGPTIELYVDDDSGQVFTKPGPGRKPLGTFRRVEPPPAAAPAAAAPAPAPPTALAPAVAASQRREEDVADIVGKIVKNKWYERISLRGYTQLRYTALLEKDGADWFAPADRSVRNGAGFLIRRGRMVFSGELSDRLSVYVQPDLNAAPTDGDFSVQLRDLYADVALDRKKEFRFRLGQSKVPFGWVNLQSSQNRIPLERPDAINAAVEGERDIGVFFYWAPAEIRERFRNLVKDGLKGSGDYGVFALGLYNGQGLNRLDSNDDLHVVGRLTYPFELPGGQFIEPGIQGMYGRFVVRRSDIPVGPGGEDAKPADFEGGRVDRRAAATFVVYPQPIGFETEWTIGDGPELVDGDTRIGTRSFWGGYVQAHYRAPVPWGTFIPFVRWQYEDGGRKFAKNAPHARVNEIDVGIEYAPIPEVEATLMYTYSPYRTNTNTYPYDDIDDGSRLGMQVQWNY
ncbi:MAG: porin [Deltaproteobacteria bacterium]|nr:porin [Deltaproteobacteria bacterium]